MRFEILKFALKYYLLFKFMIQVGTKIKIVDNTGAKIVQCFNIPGGSKKRYARIGDIIVAAVKDALPHKEIKKGDIVKCLIVRQKKPFRRKDGSWIRFDDNAAVIIEKDEVKGTRVFGPLPKELKEKGYHKLISMAKFVV